MSAQITAAQLLGGKDKPLAEADKAKPVVTVKKMVVCVAGSAHELAHQWKMGNSFLKDKPGVMNKFGTQSQKSVALKQKALSMKNMEKVKAQNPGQSSSVVSSQSAAGKAAAALEKKMQDKYGNMFP